MSKNLIWDMDGTLIDSYDSIVDCIVRTIEHYGISYEKSFIRNKIQEESTKDFFNYVSSQKDIGLDTLWDYYNSLDVNFSLIHLMPNVIELFEGLKEKDVKNFIYTHRGSSLTKVIELLDINKYFVEAVGADRGFERKPNPEAINYLVDKYNLNKEDTYYVGDRLLDQQCASNAGIKRIYYQSFKGISLDKKDYDYYIDDLLEIKKIIL